LRDIYFQYLSPIMDPPTEKSVGKGSTSLPKKLFDSNEDQTSADDSDLRTSPIITYKRRIPQPRSSQLTSDKRLKPSSPLKLITSPFVPRLASSCSTPLSVKSKPPLIVQSPMTDSDDEDSLLFEAWDEIEKSVQKESSSVASCPKEQLPEKLSVKTSFGGFSTASGTQIVVSEEAAKASEALLAFFLAEEIPDD